VAFVRKANRDEVLEELVEPFDIAGRVGRKVTCPLDGPPEGVICSVFAVNVPLPGRFENQYGIRWRLLTSESTGDRLNFVGYIGGIDLP